MPAPAPAASRPLPPIAYDHQALFREPVYADGQPYGSDDDPEDDD